VSTAREYLSFLEKELRDCDIILVHRPLGKSPKYFVGLHRRNGHPIYCHSPHLARRFSLNDRALVEKFVQHLAEKHGHEVFISKRKQDSSANHAG
jgi:hypothetical protein